MNNIFGDNHHVTIQWINGVTVTEKIPNHVYDIEDLKLFIEYTCLRNNFFYRTDLSPCFCFDLSCKITFNGEVVLRNTLTIHHLPLRSFGFKKPNDCEWEFPENYVYPIIYFDDELMKIFGFSTGRSNPRTIVGYKKFC
jgi:hypothetical protein